MEVLLMTDINILKTDSRGRVTLPGDFRKDRLFEYFIEGDQITLYPVKTLRKFPDMTGLPEEELGSKWVAKEDQVNRDKRRGVKAASPAEALKKIRK
jgi:hypothetical protein